MTTRKLVTEAREAIRFRGHVMKNFSHNGAKTEAYYQCPACEASILVLSKPMPNECEIMGDALAIDCVGSQLAMYRKGA